MVKKDAAKFTRPAPLILKETTLAELANADPFVVRRAAAWFAENPQAEALPVLLEALKMVQSEDLQLRHQLRIAIREHLKLQGAYAALTDTKSEALIDISFAVPTAEASAFLLAQWSDDVTKLLTHLARNADEQTLAAAITRARKTANGSAQDSVRQRAGRGLDRRPAQWLA